MKIYIVTYVSIYKGACFEVDSEAFVEERKAQEYFDTQIDIISRGEDCPEMKMCKGKRCFGWHCEGSETCYRITIQEKEL